MLCLEKKNENAFTLIELLVVISIIALLASVVLFSLTQARMKGRDAKRKADMAQLQKAMEVYYQEYGTYPPLAGSNPGPIDDWLFAQSLSSIMSAMPRDPSCKSGSACNYQIQLDITQTYYAIKVPFELVAVCKVESPGAPATFFNTVPVCNY